MLTPEPKISVIVCTYNREDLLGYSLQSLAEQTLDNSLYEVLVINNNSTDGTQELTEEFAGWHENFRVINEPKQGLSHARNRGWKEARGEYIAYMDDDAKAAPEWCEKILHSFRTVEPKPVAVGGKILPWYRVEPPQWFSDELEIRSWGEDIGYLQPPRRNFGFSGSNMAFTKDILGNYGGFSTQLGMVGGKMRFGEELDLFLRIADRQKLYWYDPNIIVYHFVPKRNISIIYQIKRAFLSARTRSKAEGNNFFSVKSVESFYDILKFIIRTPIILISSDNLKMTFVLKIKQLASLTGRFFS